MALPAAQSSNPANGSPPSTPMVAGKHEPPPDRFLVGGTTTTPIRTVSQADVEEFARLTGDENPIHLDETYAQRQLFGGPVAHGLLTLSLTLGLWYRAGLFDGHIVVFRGIDRLQFLKPVRPGDALSAEITILRREPSAHGEAVELENATRNARGEIVLSFSARLLLATPRGAAATL